MPSSQNPKDERTDHTITPPTDALSSASARRRPVARHPKCGRDALVGYAVGAAVGTTLALVAAVARHPNISASPSKYLWRAVVYGGIPGVAGAELYHALSATAWWAEYVEERLQ